MEKRFEINEQGLSIRCKLFYEKELQQIENVVIVLHGFGSSKDLKSNTKFGERLSSKYKGYAALAFDFPCHGDDARKKLSVEESIIYLQLVIDYAKTSLNVKNLYAYGTSFGGYLTLKYLAEKGNPFRKIALRAPAVQIYHSLMNRLSEEERQKLAKGREILWGFDRQMKISQAFFDELTDITQNDYLDYAEQMLILHGTEDEMVSLSTSQQFADNNVIELLPIEGADHAFSNPKLMDIAIGKIVEFFAP
ncbi:acetoin dehydrogenase E2 subunit dihydrolipoyllysine-residue acetyltransferase [Mannheimia haemolytica]|uniref:Acetoin dehydrogenase E2 subunit dihydrolipoyllysine-residue acetyltransferase n=1 Tax=Mannheimia haemolytica TaxID=75985 RepID=A0A3S5B6B2_MANHA|nr:alpha/beta fold hydrolase [Mannheimia haemolytica]VEI77821.1 acetoin dehydrogenase E2 subunit dihydrolipoyllysine-residue acetyltransferase [Mannheimia haemolytica]